MDLVFQDLALKAGAIVNQIDRTNPLYTFTEKDLKKFMNYDKPDPGSLEARVITVLDEWCYHSVVIQLDTTFESMNVDSLDEIEIIMGIEDEFSIDIEDNDFEEKIKTVQDLVNFVKERVRG